MSFPARQAVDAYDEYEAEKAEERREEARQTRRTASRHLAAVETIADLFGCHRHQAWDIYRDVVRTAAGEHETRQLAGDTRYPEIKHAAMVEAQLAFEQTFYHSAATSHEERRDSLLMLVGHLSYAGANRIDHSTFLTAIGEAWRNPSLGPVSDAAELLNQHADTLQREYPAFDGGAKL